MKITFEEFQILEKAMFQNYDVVISNKDYDLSRKGFVDFVTNEAGKKCVSFYKVNEAGKQIVYAMIDLIENGVDQKDAIHA